MEFRRITTTAALMLLFFCAQAQVINVDRVTARSRLTVASTEIDSISADSTFSAASDRKVPTSGAVKAYVDNNAGGSNSFNFNRPILRLPELGDTIGGNSYEDYFNFLYFAPPTLNLSITGGTLFEVGTSNSITLSGSTNNEGGSTLSNGNLNKITPAPTLSLVNIGSSESSYSTTITYTPTQGGSGNFNEFLFQFRSTQDWSGGGSSGTVNSSTRTVRAVYPVLYGVSATDLHATGDAYTTLTKLVEAEGDKTVTLNGTGFQYYAMPSTWSDTSLSQILDQNDFNVTASFTCQTVSVSSSGLTNNWTLNYEICKSNTQGTVNNADYEFNQ